MKKLTNYEFKLVGGLRTLGYSGVSQRKLSF